MVRVNLDTVGPFQEDEEGHPQALFYTKQNYPRRHGKGVREGGYMDGVPGAIEVTQQAGDVLIFVDSVVCGPSLPSVLFGMRLLVADAS